MGAMEQKNQEFIMKLTAEERGQKSVKAGLRTPRTKLRSNAKRSIIPR